MKITKELLEVNNACFGQVNLFGKLFPDGVEVTEELCLKHTNDFDFEWAAMVLLTKEQYREYQKVLGRAYQEYQKVLGRAYQKYLKVRGPAYQEYLKIRASTFARCSTM